VGAGTERKMGGKGRGKTKGGRSELREGKEGRISASKKKECEKKRVRRQVADETDAKPTKGTKKSKGRGSNWFTDVPPDSDT